MLRKELAKMVVQVIEDLDEDVNTKTEIVDTMLKVYLAEDESEPETVQKIVVPDSGYLTTVKPAKVVVKPKEIKPNKSAIKATWTKEEKDYLYNRITELGSAGVGNLKKVASELGRTWKACENMFYEVKRKGGVSKKSVGRPKGKVKKGGSFKKKRGSKQWTAEDDAKLKAFASDPDSYFRNGYTKKNKLNQLAKELGRTVDAIRFRLSHMKIGFKYARKVVTGEKTEGLQNLQRFADKINEQKQLDEQRNLPDFPDLSSIKVAKASYRVTFKHFTSNRGNKITIKEAFPLFAIDDVAQWETFLTEVLSKSGTIAASLGVENRFAMVSTPEGRVLRYE